MLTRRRFLAGVAGLVGAAALAPTTGLPVLPAKTAAKTAAPVVAALTDAPLDLHALIQRNLAEAIAEAEYQYIMYGTHENAHPLRS